MDYAPFYLITAATVLTAVTLIAFIGLKGFNGWLALKRAELDAINHGREAQPTATSRIEIADLKERLRKLESIAAGVDL